MICGFDEERIEGITVYCILWLCKAYLYLTIIIILATGTPYIYLLEYRKGRL